MAMTAMGAGNIVVLIENRDCSRSDCLLPNIQMKGTPNEPLPGQKNTLFLEGPYSTHHSI
jgi:hypothetical protein